MDRKSMLIQADLERPKAPRDPKKLEIEATEGLALRTMKESRGWKIVLEKFITPRNSTKRFLSTKTTQERHESWGALSELDELLSFIDGRIKDGQRSSEELETMKKNGRNKE